MTTQLECPYCNQKCKFLDVSAGILEILKLFPVIPAESDEVLKICSICNLFSVQNHACLNRDFCFLHSKDHTAIAKDRVVDQQMAQLFNCDLCDGFLSKPQSCVSCGSNFCANCISNHLLDKNFGSNCPSCRISKPDIKPMQANLLEVYNQIQIKCKYCNKEYPVSHEHHAKCLDCEFCLQKQNKASEKRSSETS